MVARAAAAVVAAAGRQHGRLLFVVIGDECLHLHSGWRHVLHLVVVLVVIVHNLLLARHRRA
jgi:hypothetical protein